MKICVRLLSRLYELLMKSTPTLSFLGNPASFAPKMMVYFRQTSLVKTNRCVPTVSRPPHSSPARENHAARSNASARIVASHAQPARVASHPRGRSQAASRGGEQYEYKVINLRRLTQVGQERPPGSCLSGLFCGQNNRGRRAQREDRMPEEEEVVEVVVEEEEEEEGEENKVEEVEVERIIGCQFDCHRLPPARPPRYPRPSSGGGPSR